MASFLVALVVLAVVVFRSDTVGAGTFMPICAWRRCGDCLHSGVICRLVSFLRYAFFYGCSDDSSAAWRIDVSCSFEWASSILIIYVLPVVLLMSLFASESFLLMFNLFVLDARLLPCIALARGDSPEIAYDSSLCFLDCIWPDMVSGDLRRLSYRVGCRQFVAPVGKLLRIADARPCGPRVRDCDRCFVMRC